MIKGITDSGFEFEIDENSMNDMEVVDALARMIDNDLLAMPILSDKMLGKDQKKRLYDHIRRDDGRVLIEDFTKEILDIFAKGGEATKK